MEIVSLVTMEYVVDCSTLQALWDLLNEKASPSKISAARRLFKDLVKSGWVLRTAVEDLVYYLDSRLNGHVVDVITVSKFLGIHWEMVCFRPNAKSNYASEYEALRVKDAALLLIRLERIGFQTDATELVKMLLPGIKSRKRKIFSEAELEIFWFVKTRHKHAGIRLKATKAALPEYLSKSLKTDSGYNIGLHTDDEGHPLLQIQSPKFRNRREPELTTCPECSFEWRKGDPDSSASHRKEHKRRMVYLNPKPLEAFILERSKNSDAELVTYDSAAWKHYEMYERARAFKKEFHYDFIQWKSPKGNNDPDIYGFLFADDAGAIVGACAFRQYNGKSAGKYFGLQWIWICPKERRKGHLSFRWLKFRERFANFHVEPPVSDAMKAFLEAKGDTALLEKP